MQLPTGARAPEAGKDYPFQKAWPKSSEATPLWVELSCQVQPLVLDQWQVEGRRYWDSVYKEW